MLVARCVVEVGAGTRTDLGKITKVSAKQFGDHAGISHKTVTAYLKTWDAMAQDGIVPPRGYLGRDEEIRAMFTLQVIALIFSTQW